MASLGMKHLKITESRERENTQITERERINATLSKKGKRAAPVVRFSSCSPDYPYTI